MPKFSQSLRGGRKRSQQFRPSFKIGSDTRQTNELLIESSLKEGSTPRFRPSLKDLTDKSIVWKKNVASFKMWAHRGTQSGLMDSNIWHLIGSIFSRSSQGWSHVVLLVTIKYLRLIPSYQWSRHLYLSGMWLDVDTKSMTCIWKTLDYVLIICSSF
jgi:hypothetical protein